MKAFPDLSRAGFSGEITRAPRYPILLDPQQPVFSPAVRFAPKELSLSRAIKRVAPWASIIAIAITMGRSGFSYFRQVWSERPGYHSTR
jgi:hypothetical protein